MKIDTFLLSVILTKDHQHYIEKLFEKVLLQLKSLMNVRLDGSPKRNEERKKHAIKNTKRIQKQQQITKVTFVLCLLG